MNRLFRNVLITLLGSITLFSNLYAQDSSGVSLVGVLRDTTGWNFEGIVVSGNYAYTAGENSIFHSIDISNPTTPIEIGFCSMPSSIPKLVKVDTCVYVSAYTAGLRIIDVAQPNLPFELGHFITSSPAYGLAVSDGYAFVAASNIEIINVAVPSECYEVANCAVQGGATSVVVSGNYAYIAGDSGLTILDISVINAPQQIGFFPIHPMPFVIWPEIALFGNFIFFNSTTYVHCIDVSDPTLPQEVSSYDLSARGITLSGNHLFGINGGDLHSTLRILDVTNPAVPQLVGYNTAIPAPNVFGIAVTGNYAYLASPDLLCVYDCSQALGVVDRTSDAIPEKFSLKQNYPNPFNPTTTIEYALPRTSRVELKLFDVTGRAVGTLVNFSQNPGTYRVKVDGSKLASGMNFYRLNTGTCSVTKKMMLIR